MNERRYKVPASTMQILLEGFSEVEAARFCLAVTDEAPFLFSDRFIVACLGIRRCDESLAELLLDHMLTDINSAFDDAGLPMVDRRGLRDLLGQQLKQLSGSGPRRMRRYLRG